MEVQFRFCYLAVAAFLYPLMSTVVFAAPASQSAVRWSELAPLLKGREISVRLSGGAIVGGKYSGIQANTLTMQATRTSEPSKHPKGVTQLARSDIEQITIQRHAGWKGRAIGLIAGGAVTAVVAGVISAIAKNEGGWGSGYAGVAGGVSAAAIGGGYLIGWLADREGSRPEQVVQILQEGAGQ